MNVELRQKKSSKPWREAQKVVIRDSRIEWHKGVSKKFQWQNFSVIDVELIGEMQKKEACCWYYIEMFEHMESDLIFELFLVSNFLSLNFLITHFQDHKQKDN